MSQNNDLPHRKGYNSVNLADYNDICKLRNDLDDLIKAKELLKNVEVLTVQEVDEYFQLPLEELAKRSKALTDQMIQLVKKDRGLAEAIARAYF